MLRSTLDVIREEVRRTPKTETGGALVGYLSTEGALVVTHASGPGPRAKLKARSVLIDGKHAQDFCTRLFAESEGQLDYVGDWHRHPGWSLAASEHDLQAMLTIAESGCCTNANPLSAIYRSWPEHLVTYALVRGRLRSVPMEWVEREAELKSLRFRRELNTKS
jgi:integrative and conjugative element protein (TIGR02256 family)